ncbi:trypsin-like peptidase domain-containing protein [Hyalangium rubrum]|uniref:Trypsin-like peptidase domain-containing protein n=1 Tax=Hyalangium rubrum TaxID=3103134 RepID=A0ABU5H2F0_9BACT|nr:trypsin-like peptidase domain-containing protein [Hyalangium sp. s54d21]MDY7227643.1 trypsin-like peptidase domain-containing protein [Hyalangium sp. s54d21]
MKARMSSRVSALLLAALALVSCGKESPPNESKPEVPASSETGHTSREVTLPSPIEALGSLAPLTESVRAAVVNVEVRASGVPRRGTPPWQGERRGLGSGFIIDPTGLVLTNNHVVENAVEIQVQLLDGRQFPAELLGTDPLTDVALLRLRGQNVKELPVVKLGDSDAMRVGDWVLAIGNPFGLASSVSLGILSAKARDIQAGPYDDFLQTDAAINPGNSGGPLFNMKGEVIGINTAIAGGGTGIGFAVPSNLVQVLLPQLEKEGAVTRGWLGLGAQDLTPALAEALGLTVRSGAIVVSVEEGTPSAKAGLEPDDVIVFLNEKPITSAGSLTRAVGLMRPGTEVRLELYREGKKHERQVTLGTRPDLEGLATRGVPHTEEESQQRVGLGVSDVAPRLSAQGVPRGALITNVLPGSAAERAGLMPGMVVVEANQKPVRGAADFVRTLREAAPGSVLLLRVQVEDTRALRALTLPD